MDVPNKKDTIVLVRLIRLIKNFSLSETDCTLTTLITIQLDFAVFSCILLKKIIDTYFTM